MPTVDVPQEHYDAFEKRAEEKDLDSAEAYIGYVLEQIYEKLQRQEQQQESAYTEEEEEKVKERLRGLGYLD